MIFQGHQLSFSRAQIALVLSALAAALLVGIFVSPLLALVAVVGCVLAALIARSPFFGLGLLVFLLPFERLGSYETPLGTIRPSQLIGLLLIVAVFIRYLLERRRGRPNPMVLPLAVFIAVNIVSLTNALNVSYGIRTMVITAFTILVGMVVPHLVRTEKGLRKLSIILIYAAIVTGIFGLFQFFGDLAGLPTSITGLRDLYTKDVFGFPRIQSTALEPLYYADFLLLPISILYAQFVRKKTIFPQWVNFLVLALLVANLALTVSRGGYLAFAASIGVITLLSLRQFLRLRVLVTIVAGIALLLFLVPKILQFGDVTRINVETFTSHIGNVFFGASFTERSETIDQAKNLFWSSPLTGIGPGNFGPAVAAHPLLEPKDGWRIVNNETMEVLVETGILGLLSLVTALGVVFARSVKIILRKPSSSLTATIHMGLLGAFIGVLVQYQTFSVLYIMHIWVLVGLLLAAQNILLFGESHD